jgi:hypothetical protein
MMKAMVQASIFLLVAFFVVGFFGYATFSQHPEAV